MNRYYSYTQVFFNRHVSILEFMSEALSEAFLKAPGSEFPDREALWQAVEHHCDGTDFLYFTDRAFWDSLHHMEFPAGSFEAVFQRLLLRYQEMELTKNRELSVNFTGRSELMAHLSSHPIYRNLDGGVGRPGFFGGRRKEAPCAAAPGGDHNPSRGQRAGASLRQPGVFDVAALQAAGAYYERIPVSRRMIRGERRQE